LEEKDASIAKTKGGVAKSPRYLSWCVLEIIEVECTISRAPRNSEGVGTIRALEPSLQIKERESCARPRSRDDTKKGQKCRGGTYYAAVRKNLKARERKNQGKGMRQDVLETKL